MDVQKRSQLKYLIKKITHTNKEELDKIILKQIKSICKESDLYVTQLFLCVMQHLKRKHAEIRYNCLLVCNEIFYRSHYFRILLLNDFEKVVNYLLPINGVHNIKPLSVATKLETKTITFFNEWYNKFRPDYALLNQNKNYLEHKMNVDFQKNKVVTPGQREKELLREKYIQENKESVLVKVQHNLSTCESDVTADLTTFKNAFRLLIPSVDEFFIPLSDCPSSISNSSTNTDPTQQEGNSNADESDEETVVIDIADIRKIIVTEDNESVVQTLNDVICTINKKWMPKFEYLFELLQPYREQNWDCTQTVLDIHKSLKSAVDIYKSLNIIGCTTLTSIDKSQTSNEFDEEDDEFDEVLVENNDAKSESYLLSILMKGTSNNTKLGQSSKCSQSTSIHRGNEKHLASRECVSLNGLTPDHFKNQCVPPSLCVNPLAGPSQVWLSSSPSLDDSISPRHGALGISTHAVDLSTPYEPVKWYCRAPLPSGRLCPRQDRSRCPLHGPTVPRDADSGEPDVEYAQKLLQLAEQLEEKSNNDLYHNITLTSDSSDVTNTENMEISTEIQECSISKMKKEPISSNSAMRNTASSSLSVSQARKLLETVMEVSEKEARRRMGLDKDWQNPQLLSRIKKQTGIDLDMRNLRKRSSGSLTDIKTTSAKERLSKVVMKKRRRAH